LSPSPGRLWPTLPRLALDEAAQLVDFLLLRGA
jgi:hypothetical protein